jgi:hypothetical protein
MIFLVHLLYEHRCALLLGVHRCALLLGAPMHFVIGGGDALCYWGSTSALCYWGSIGCTLLLGEHQGTLLLGSTTMHLISYKIKNNILVFYINSGYWKHRGVMFWSTMCTLLLGRAQCALCY